MKKVNEESLAYLIYQPKKDIQTEFTKPVEEKLYLSKNVPKLKPFLSGLE